MRSGGVRSPRFRRRAAWAAVVLAAAGAALAATQLLESNPAFPKQTLRDDPVQRVELPPPARLTPADTAQVARATQRFLRDAVAQKDLRSAYDVVGPELRAGMTREQWVKGNPVIPFPVGRVHQTVLAYSYRNDVAFDVGVVAKPGSDTVAKAFRIELRRATAAAPWKVVAWQPLGVSGPGNVRSARDRLASAPPPPPRHTIAAWWLALPGGLLSCALLIPVVLWIRSWRASRRAERRYRDALGLPSDL